MTRTLTILTALALSATAQAFCGYYAGSAGTEVFNYASEAALVRQGTRTTITLKNDFQGATADFALVLPVPIVLQQGDVRVVDEQLFYRLDAWSAPREVFYECPVDWGWSTDALADSGGGVTDAADSGGVAPPPVIIENEFIVGDYEIVILSAQDSGALVTWLTTNGYGVSSNAEALLGEYIAAGMYFFAAKVTAPPTPSDEPTFLAPLQFSFDADELMLPIRLGTLNSEGEQDLIVYVINAVHDGRATINNYPASTIEDECMWPADAPGQTFAEYYAARFTDAWDARTGPLTWVEEYGWATSWCDPCATPTLTNGELEALGWDEGAVSDTATGTDWGWDPPYDTFLTRLHLRYQSDVPQDLSFTLTGDATTAQMRFIRYDHLLEDQYPVCGLGMLPNPGTCDDDTAAAPWESDPWDSPTFGDSGDISDTDGCAAIQGCTDSGYSGEVCASDGNTYTCKDVAVCYGLSWTEGPCADTDVDTDAETDADTDLPPTDARDTAAILEDPDTDGGAPMPETGLVAEPTTDPRDCSCAPGAEAVCGDDGLTYACDAAAECAGQAWRSGPCPVEDPPECDTCPDTATPPVCAEDGVTYPCWYMADCLGLTYVEGNCDDLTDLPDPATDAEAPSDATDATDVGDPDPATDTDVDPEVTDEGPAATDAEATDAEATDPTDADEPTSGCAGGCAQGGVDGALVWVAAAMFSRRRRA